MSDNDLKANDREKTAGLIGLGLVGSALCERLRGAGFAVIGYDIDERACAQAAARGARIAESPRDVAAAVDRTLLSLPDSGVVRKVLLGGDGATGIFESSTAARTIIDTTTGSPAAVEELAIEASRRSLTYLDACIVGSSSQVREGKAVVVAGGPAEAIEASADLFETFAKHTFHMGPTGAGTRGKLVVNLVLGLNRLVLAEGLSLAGALELDLERALEVLKSGVSYSTVMDTKGPKMLARDFEPQARLRQHLKDVDLIRELAAESGLNLPLTELHRELLSEGVDLGLGDLDNSAILEVLRRRGAS